MRTHSEPTATRTLAPAAVALSLALAAFATGGAARAEKPAQPAEKAAPKKADDKGKGAKKAGPIADDAQIPAGHPKLPTVKGDDAAPQIQEPAPNAGTGKQALSWKAPSDWVSVKPGSPMRKAQYRIPGPAGDGEMVVYYFGANEGGGAIPNAQRWAGQFTLPDGRRGVETMKTEERTVGEIHVLVVEAGGTYSGDMTNPGVKPNYALLGAIAEGPDANWFFKLTGPKGTVEAQRKAFDDLVQSLKRGASK